MAVTGVLGAIGTVIGLTRALPQLLRLIKTRDAHGVSLDSAATISVVSFAWATYGLLTDQLAVAVASGLNGSVFICIALMAMSLGRRVSELRAAPIWLVVVMLATFVAGSGGLGAVLVVSALIANLPQVVVAYRERDLTGLSPSTWALTASDGAVWSFYGILTGDIPILVNNLFQFTTSMAILIRRLVWSSSTPSSRGLQEWSIRLDQHIGTRSEVVARRALKAHPLVHRPSHLHRRGRMQADGRCTRETRPLDTPLRQMTSNTRSSPRGIHGQQAERRPVRWPMLRERV